jgi:hypothetical protein
MSAVRALALLAALAVSAVAAMTAGAAAARHAPATSSIRNAAAKTTSPATCVVHSLPSFIAQGENINAGQADIPNATNTEATVADVIEVECDPTVYGTGSKIKITASQLFTRCQGRVTWYVPNPFSEQVEARGITVRLDADGNATVALRAGPECAAGESLVTAHMEEEPFETFTTSFSVLPPVNTPPGVFALPATQVEDSSSSGVAAIIETEFPGGSEKLVHIASEELFHRCQAAPHLHWIRMNGAKEEGVPEVNEVQLDNNGNAFVIVIGDASCAEGPSLIEADLLSKPFTTFATNFTTEPPQPTGEASFTIEKRQQIAGSASGFTASPLTGAVGKTVDYQITVKNTANVSETFAEFTDTHCGTISGGPGSSPVAPGQSTIYTCNHVLSAVGSYTNEATVTATTVGEPPLTHTSNQVVVNVPATNHVVPTVPAESGPVKSQQTTPGAGPGPAPPTPRGGVLPQCEASQPALRGVSGPKRGAFTLQVSSRGIKQITFYLDGRKLKALKQSQAKGGKFTITIDPRQLSYGAHKVSIKTVMSDAHCATIARSGVFVHPQIARVPPKFTG